MAAFGAVTKLLPGHIADAIAFAGLPLRIAAVRGDAFAAGESATSPTNRFAGRASGGLCRALGAAKGHIRIQCAVEAVLLALIGGAADVGAGGPW